MKPLMEADVMRFYPGADLLLERWADEIEVVSEAYGNKELSLDRQVALAICLENTQMQITRVSQALNEVTQPTDVGLFRKYAINLVAAVMPNLIANDIVSVQGMTAKTGEVRYLKLLYGSNKGGISSGDLMRSTFVAGDGKTTYSSETVDGESLGTVGENNYTGNFAWLPIRPGSISISIDNVILRDVDAGNGKGTLVAFSATGTPDNTYLSSSTGTNFIDYSSGAYDITLNNAAVTTSAPIATYDYNSEVAPATVPEVNLKIDTLPMTARPRKLKVLYSFDAAFDMQRDYGTKINTELTAYTAAQIKYEIDGEILKDLLTQAGATSVQFNRKVPEGISMLDHYESFNNSIVSAGNNIFGATQFATGTFIVVGKDAANILETLAARGLFVRSGATKAVGPHLAGYLGGLPVYKNPYYADASFLVGFKGDGLFDSGYVYAPYMPILTTQLIMDADFQGSRGFATSYAKRMVNSNMYAAGSITNV